ncbi:hypothetical protein CUJ91_04690 [Paraburkholderia graminis]|uniref:hypothetical protein n=1 Tax=Paraburkholderia graminis TaxID=60548 RepID=UPI000DEEB7F4|nr:hypothetical protein [Paraburkholderia graminis]AXF07294.1 hypothetical protein CUJ91_04690 [Paraburkholderia graminis]
MTTLQERVRAPLAVARPRLDVWSVRQAESVEITGQARADYERELRISALGNLMCADGATPLWRRVCCHAMRQEIHARSPNQRLAMELALQESMR